jgi:hypothetical protein
MADITLSDGREITFDLNKISIREYRALFKTTQPDDEEYASLAKVCGLKPDDVASLGYVDWRKLCLAFFNKAREPLADPNLPSASTST